MFSLFTHFSFTYLYIFAIFMHGSRGVEEQSIKTGEQECAILFLFHEFRPFREFPTNVHQNEAEKQ